MHSSSFLAHAAITLAVALFHLVLFWLANVGGPPRRRASNARAWLRAKFVGLMFLVLVTFANTALVFPRELARATALIAIALLAAIFFRWRRESFT